MALPMLTAAVALMLSPDALRPHPAPQRAIRMQDRPVHLVYYTGSSDLRVHDHGGLCEAAEAAASVLPVFVLEAHHLQATATPRLHAALSGLDGELQRGAPCVAAHR